MIESYLTQNMITRGETALGDYLRSGQSDFGNIWREAFNDLMTDLINRNTEVRRLCKRFYLESTALTKTAAYDGVLSDEDFGQRLRLVIPVTAITGTGVFTLQGTDDEGVTYYNINMISDSGASSSSLSVTEATTYSFSSTALFKKYRLRLISIGTTITYSRPYLIEEIYTTIHREKTRANIYRTLMNENAIYTEKFNLYMNEYNRLLNEGKMIFDVGDDEDIEEGESEQEPLNIIFR